METKLRILALAVLMAWAVLPLSAQNKGGPSGTNGSGGTAAGSSAPGESGGAPSQDAGRAQNGPDSLEGERKSFRSESGSGGKGSGTEALMDWFGSSAQGRLYASIAERIRVLALEAEGAGVPAEAFRLRLKEAAAKRVPPEAAALALEEDTRLWLRVAAALGEAPWPPKSQAADFYLAAAVALRNGVGELTLRGIAVWAVDSRGSADRAAAVLTAAAALAPYFGAAELSSLAVPVAASRLRTGDFGALVSLLREARQGGASAAEIASTVGAVLGARGSLKDLKKRLLP